MAPAHPSMPLDCRGGGTIQRMLWTCRRNPFRQSQSVHYIPLPTNVCGDSKLKKKKKKKNEEEEEEEKEQGLYSVKCGPIVYWRGNKIVNNALEFIQPRDVFVNG